MDSGLQGWLGLPTLGLAIALVVTVIGARLTTDSANLLLGSAWVLATISIFSFPYIGQLNVIPRVLSTLLVSSIVGLTLYQLRWEESVATIQPSPDNNTLQAQATDPASAVHGPLIEISYDLKGFGLPIPLEPFSTISIVVIRDSRKVELLNLVNNKDKRMLWPTEEPITPPELIGRITLSNLGDITLFNVTYSVSFNVGGEKEDGGVMSQQIELPLHNLPVGQSQSFYIVNQSSTGAGINFSKEAVGQMQGQTERQRMIVRPRDITFFDRTPIIMSQFHKWSGDNILEPNQWKDAPKN